jgi:hypothetical protein
MTTTFFFFSFERLYFTAIAIFCPLLCTKKTEISYAASANLLCDCNSTIAAASETLPRLTILSYIYFQHHSTDEMVRVRILGDREKRR